MSLKDDTESETDTKEFENPPKYESYIMGFVLSLVLTLAAYFIVVADLASGWGLILTISALAFVQVILQLVFFLHLGEEPSPPWNLIAFLFMVMVVLILIIGSLWIMWNLDYQMTSSPTSQHTHMHKE